MGGFFGGGASVDLASPPAIGNTTPNTGRFTTVGVGTSVSGSAKLSVLGASDTSAQVIFNGAQWFGSVNGNQGVLYQGDITGKVKVIALNQAFTAYRTLELVSDGNTFSFPASAGTLVVSSGFSSPPAIGNTTPNTGKFTTLEAASLQISTSGFLFGGTNLLEQRNSTNSQTFRLYRTFTDASNYERLSLIATRTTRFAIAAENAGTGAARSLEISFYTSASDPTSTDITSGCFSVWKNSGTGTIKLWANDGGTMKSVALA